jgi:transglutaminase-like putative cysteine protease
MGAIVQRSYLQASSNLAADLARYGNDAQWHGVYYRGEKIGFSVRQMSPAGRGFELQEDGRLQMSLLGATTATRIRTTAHVDQDFGLESFEFSMDPGTGPLTVKGQLDGLTLSLEITTASGTRSETRQLDERPVLAVGIGRRLVTSGLKPGATYQWTVFDPATLQNAALVARVGERQMIASGSRRGSVPAFPVTMEFVGLQTTAWVTDTGETVREESPLGLITIRESAESARMMAVTINGRTDLLEAAAVVPKSKHRITEPRDVRRLRMALSGADFSGFELDGVNQSFKDGILELRDPQQAPPAPADPDVSRYLDPEPMIESDDDGIRTAAAAAVQGVKGQRAQAERLVRYVNDLLEKKPTVSLPSAREVLRTRVGDCNEHTALYVAMARSLGIPARINTGLAFTRGAFYYHAWPEIYIAQGTALGSWIPVDPTFNQFPADATHIRFARGGLEKQTAILPLIGRLEISILELELASTAVDQVVVGRPATDRTPLSIAMPQRSSSGRCWDTPGPVRR